MQMDARSCYKPFLKFSGLEICMWGGRDFRSLPTFLLQPFVYFLVIYQNSQKIRKEKRVKDSAAGLGADPMESHIPFGILVDGTES